MTCPLLWQDCDQEQEAVYPEVAGTYRGTLTVTVSADSIAGPMEMAVYQGDNAWQPNNDVTVRASTSLSEVPLIPGLIGVIDETGVFTWIEGGTDYDPACGVTTTGSVALSFSGRTALFQSTLRTVECGVFRLEAVMERR